MSDMMPRAAGTVTLGDAVAEGSGIVITTVRVRVSPCRRLLLLDNSEAGASATARVEAGRIAPHPGPASGDIAKAKRLVGARDSAIKSVQALLVGGKSQRKSST